ncbi:MAG: PEP-CTERM sorting domain-containing protein [Chthoniobacteraceae bacterium]
MFPQSVGSRATVRKPGLAGLLFFFTPDAPGAAVVSVPNGIGAAFVRPAPEIAVTFRFEVVDLADTTPGQDLWEYRYTVSGLTLTAGQGFTIFFDFNLYTLLQNPPPLVNADWDPITVQPDLALHSNGFYDAQALRNAPSLADPFRVQFVWLGSAGTTPSSQPVTVYNADFSTQSQGQTVPEPASLALLLAAATLLARRPRKVVPGFNPSQRTKAG